MVALVCVLQCGKGMNENVKIGSRSGSDRILDQDGLHWPGSDLGSSINREKFELLTE